MPVKRAKPAKRAANAKNTRKAAPAARSSRTRAAAPAKAASRKVTSPKATTPKVASPKATSGQKATKESAPVVRRTSAELHFTETTIIRGDAVEPGDALPSGATHEIAGQDDCGQPIIKRKRFSIY